MSVTVSHNQFFFLLGNADSTSLEASKPLHEAYINATPEQQKDLRHRAVVNYVMGKMNITQSEAEKIVAKTRVKRTKEQEKAVNAAGQKARYHLVTRGKDKKPAPAKTHGKAEFTRAQLSAAKQFVKLFESVTEAKKALGLV
jgi:hypothetical protein